MPRQGSIYYAEKDPHTGWILIRGCIGPRRYLYYSMREAKAKYRAEVLEKRICYGNTVIYVEGRK